MPNTCGVLLRYSVLQLRFVRIRATDEAQKIVRKRFLHTHKADGNTVSTHFSVRRKTRDVASSSVLARGEALHRILVDESPETKYAAAFGSVSRRSAARFCTR